MSGHSHWSGIKHKKEITDYKRSKIFSKILSAISSAAKPEPNPDFNPRLRTLVLKARDLAVPQDNIERAILKAKESSENLEDLVFEAYGAGGTAILMHAISDNRNRTVQEIKLILKENNGKWAETGSVQWVFEPKKDSFFEWEPKFPIKISDEDKEKLANLIETLDENDSVQSIFVNTNLENEE